ncbi:phosphoglycerate dehydrogenase-like enzyme [Bradyrhizobium sp. GM2.4]
MTVIGSKRDIAEAIAGVDKLFPPHDLAQLLRVSDFVVLAVPHLPETAGLIGRNEFELMRDTAFLINVARGSVVVESDLVDALRASTIAGAALDVFEREPFPDHSPLWTMSNVIVSPISPATRPTT